MSEQQWRLIDRSRFGRTAFCQLDLERPGWPLGKLTVLDGDPGLGKKHLCASIAGVTGGPLLPETPL
jgi:hypothetical protein